MQQAKRVGAARHSHNQRIARTNHLVLRERRANLDDKRVAHGAGLAVTIGVSVGTIVGTVGAIVGAAGVGVSVADTAGTGAVAVGGVVSGKAAPSSPSRMTYSV